MCLRPPSRVRLSWPGKADGVKGAQRTGPGAGAAEPGRTHPAKRDQSHAQLVFERAWRGPTLSSPAGARPKPHASEGVTQAVARDLGLRDGIGVATKTVPRRLHAGPSLARPCAAVHRSGGARSSRVPGRPVPLQAETLSAAIRGTKNTSPCRKKASARSKRAMVTHPDWLVVACSPLAPQNHDAPRLAVPADMAMPAWTGTMRGVGGFDRKAHAPCPCRHWPEGAR